MITDLKEAIEYLMKNKKGDINTLEATIDSELIAQFKQVGYISTRGKNNYVLRFK